MKGNIVGNDGRRHLEISIEPGLYGMKVKKKNDGRETIYSTYECNCTQIADG